MKISICLTILAFSLACVSTCDPDGSNKPVCTSSNLNQTVRNFWDPTRYWLCTSLDAEPQSIHCPNSHGFDSAKGICVAFDEWQWTEPCLIDETN